MGIKEYFDIKIKEYHVNKIRLHTIIIVFSTVYCLISLVNHFLFRTYALDLGMYNHALFSFAHFKQAYFTLGIDGVEMPFLGTHFSVIIIILSPLYYIFGSYTLLIIQIIAILLGGFAVYKLARFHLNPNTILPLIILIQFFSIWGIYSALSFDFHCNVLGAMLIPWFIYFIEKRELIRASIFLLLTLFTTETMALWAFFIIIGLIMKNWSVYKKDYIKFEIPAAIFCFLYGALVIGVIMPSIQGSASNLQFGRYAHLGNSLSSILQTIIQNPVDTMSLLFKNTLNDPTYDGIKQELFLMVFVSGGIALLLRPVYLFMLIPIFAQKLLSNDYALWGINSHYSIEFVPILSIAIIDLLRKLKNYKGWVAIFLTLTTLIFTVNVLDHRKSKWYNKTNNRFYSKAHYKSDIDIEETNSALKLISDDASVSVSPCMAPRLAFREKIYHFPIIKNADYIVLTTNEGGTYPLSEDEFYSEINELKNSSTFITIYNNNSLMIFKRCK